MTDEKEIRNAIGRYLEKIAAELGDIPAQDKDVILQDVESHIYEALRERAGNSPKLADIEAVLAAMAPPSSYSIASRGAQAQEGGARHGEPKLCKLPLIGAFWAPFGLLAFLMGAVAVRVDSGSQGPPLALMILGWAVILPLGVTAPFATTTLGLVGISRIRASRGLLFGMPLAVVTSVLYPLAAIDLALNYAFAAVIVSVTRVMQYRMIATGVFVAFALLLDILVFVVVWRWASRPLAKGELP